MATMNIIGRIPMGYNDFGADALTDKGQEKLDELISNRLPDAVYWCGEEVIAPAGWDGTIEIDEIISAARDEIMEKYQSEEYWEA